MVNPTDQRIDELETRFRAAGEELLAARTAALSPEFVARKEQDLAEAWHYDGYRIHPTEVLEDRLEQTKALRREKQAAYETTLVVDVKIARLEAELMRRYRASEE